MCAGRAKLLSAEMKVAIHIFRDVLVQPIIIDGKTTYTLPREEHLEAEVEQQCLDFIKSRVPGFTRLGDVYGELEIRFVPMPGYDEECGWVRVENSHGKVGVRMTSDQGGEYERFVRSCLQLAKIGTIWISFSSRASVLMNVDRLKFMDQGETFESMKIKFDLDNQDPGLE